MYVFKSQQYTNANTNKEISKQGSTGWHLVVGNKDSLRTHLHCLVWADVRQLLTVELVGNMGIQFWVGRRLQPMVVLQASAQETAFGWGAADFAVSSNHTSYFVFQQCCLPSWHSYLGYTDAPWCFWATSTDQTEQFLLIKQSSFCCLVINYNTE